MAPQKSRTEAQASTISCHAQADSVKSAVASTSTCSSSTVTILQLLLSIEPKGAPTNSKESEKENGRVKKGVKSASANTTTRARTPAQAAIAKTKSDNSGTQADGKQALSAREKFLLATEVFNASLKALSAALKPQPKLQHRNSSQKLSSRSPIAGNGSHTRSISSPTPNRTLARTQSGRPLVERSASQVSNVRLQRRSSSYSSTNGINTPNAGLTAVAECSQLALAFLRTPMAEKVAGKDLPPLQVESGMLALIGKMLALGLDTLAVRELRVLKKRLESFMGCRNVEKEKETLATLLKFQSFDNKSEALPLLLNYQSHVLKVIAAAKRPAVTEAALEYLDLSCPSAPANIILAAAKLSNGETKAARQLEALAQTLLSLCAGVTSAEDTVSLDQKINVNPETALSLQILAFQIKKQWWKLAGHQPDLEKELLIPLSKCIGAFARRSAVEFKRRYEIALSACNSFEEIMTTKPNKSFNIACTSLVEIFATVSSLAQSADMTDAAVQWTEKALSASAGCTISESKMARLKVKLATAYLIKSSPSESQEKIQAALDCMEGSLKGTSADLGILLNEVVILRKAAMRSILAISAAPDQKKSSCFDICSSIVSTSIRFLSRYLGSAPADGSEPEAFIRHGERVQMANKLIKGFLDSGIACCKIFLDARRLSWETLDRILRDSTHVLQELKPAGGNAEEILQFHQQLQFPAVKISSLYWMYYLQLTKSGGAQSDILSRCLRRSVEAVRGQSTTEKESSLLPLKLERLGALYESSSHFKEAREAYYEAVRTIIDTGALRTATKLASSTMMEAIVTSNAAMTQLNKLLGRLFQLQIRRKYKDTLNDEVVGKFISPEETGLFLEMQLLAMSTALTQSKSMGDAEVEQWSLLSTRILDVYTPDLYPIRRLRSSILILKIAAGFSGPIDQDISEACLACSTQQYASNSKDTGLQSHKQNLEAMLDCIIAFRMQPVSTEKLKSSLLTWQSIITQCNDFESLLTQISSPAAWKTQIQSIVEYLDMQGVHDLSIPALRLINRVVELEGSSDAGESVQSSTTLALRYLRLGYTQRAGVLFAKVQKLLESAEVSAETKLQWHLGYAEYLLDIGNSEQSAEVLEAAEAIAAKDLTSHLDRPAATISERIQTIRLVADACYMRSLLALEAGDTELALLEGRRCIKLNHRVWASLENRYGSKTLPQAESTDTEMEAVTEGMANLCNSSKVKDGKSAMVTQHSSLSGAPFWSLVPSLFRAFSHMSRVFVHLGLLQDANYFSEQAQKIAVAVGAESMMIWNLSIMAENWTKGERLDKAAECLALARESSNNVGPSLEKAFYHRASATIYHAQGEEEDEMESLDEADRLLTLLISEEHLEAMEKITSEEDILTSKMGKMKLSVAAQPTKPTKAVRGKATTATAKRAATASRKKAAPEKIDPTSTLPTWLPLWEHHGDVLRLKAMMLLQDDVKAAETLLLRANELSSAHKVSLKQQFADFKRLMHQSMRQMAGDLTFNVLPESTIAFPAVARADRRISDHTGRKPNLLSPPQKPAGRSPSPRKAPRSKALTKQDFTVGLVRAYEAMSEVKDCLQQTGSVSMVQQVFRAMSSAAILLSVTTSGGIPGSLHPLHSAFLSNFPHSHALLLEQSCIQAEKQEISRTSLLKWPSTHANALKHQQLTTAKFQRDFIDIIPPSWTAVSLSMNAAQDEIYITRYKAHESPFILRLPMSRHRSDDMDEEVFDFEAGKAELAEIINLSNFSTHATTDMSVKGAKTEWWAEREALDARLRDLLVNMENIWFGGFRGIFSQHQRQSDLLARFQKSLHGILDRHLPSRRGRKKSKPFSFDPRVLELFIGLGDATNEEIDLDEPLMDLLYFIVDILQFNGERNAYDEIDFDSMALETLDALKCYYSSSMSNIDTSEQHTILILDADLHAFPWESMPSLMPNSISRLPSLAALRDRIIAIQPRKDDEGADFAGKDGLQVSRMAGGTSILNPGGDLKNTATTISPYLASLPHQESWSHHTSLPSTPKETESLFASALTTKPLCLYFGHGSGAQYVRPRSIRRLEACATTWLMGCSSNAVDTHGEFTPSGMVLSYLNAGAPAVIGSLWDVTDRDCDRFAVRCGEIWGLWEKQDEVNPEAGGKGKGRVKKRVMEVEKKAAKLSKSNVTTKSDGNLWENGQSLIQAVTKARDACYLRYLNGAAMVVYGIPVYLC